MIQFDWIYSAFSVNHFGSHPHKITSKIVEKTACAVHMNCSGSSVRGTSHIKPVIGSGFCGQRGLHQYAAFKAWHCDLYGVKTVTATIVTITFELLAQHRFRGAVIGMIRGW